MFAKRASSKWSIIEKLKIRAFFLKYTQELAWKVMKDYEEYQGYTDVQGSRDAIRKALQMGIIEDTAWMSTLSHFPNIQKAILFGSRTKGTNKPFSDVDIALVGDAISLNDLLNLKNEIDDLLLPYEFDFCIYKDLKNPELISQSAV